MVLGDVLAHPVKIDETLVLKKLVLLQVGQSVVCHSHGNRTTEPVGLSIKKKGTEAVALGLGLSHPDSGDVAGVGGKVP